MRDETDGLLEAWQRERPDLDVTPLSVLPRVTRLARHLDRERRAAFAQHDLEAYEFDVLSALRRAGPPYELTPGQLVRETLVGSGTMTNRLDRLSARGLIERRADPEDGRGRRVRLTEQGRDRANAAVADLAPAGEAPARGLVRAGAGRARATAAYRVGELREPSDRRLADRGRRNCRPRSHTLPTTAAGTSRGRSSSTPDSAADPTPRAAEDDRALVSTSHRFRAVLRIPDFRRLWMSLSFSSFGDWLGLLATTALAAELANGYAAANFALGGVLVVRLLPALVFGPLAGAFADRFDRRMTMVVADLSGSRCSCRSRWSRTLGGCSSRRS